MKKSLNKTVQKVSQTGLRYFCQIGQLSNDFKTKNGTIVKQNLLDLRADSHTGQLSKKVDSHPGKLSNIIFGSQPPRTIVKLHFQRIFTGKIL